MALDNHEREIIFQDLDSYSVDERGNSCKTCKHFFNSKFPDNTPCVDCSRCSKFEPIVAEVEFPECDDYGYKNVDVPDPVSSPSHYTNHPSGVECITIAEHMCFNLGNAMKYIWRSDLKWNRTEDIKKAIWYLERELKRERKVNDE